MARKMTGKKIHYSMQGKAIDFEALRNSNEKSVAVGNTGTNSRGDKLGKGGKIIKKRDEK
tara:strand:- start:5 stop:184 length:180 start_codon:yes stop_codon:yes gene_type:complete